MAERGAERWHRRACRGRACPFQARTREQGGAYSPRRPLTQEAKKRVVPQFEGGHEGAGAMAQAPMTLEQVRESQPWVNRALESATADRDIRRHPIEDGEVALRAMALTRISDRRSRPAEHTSVPTRACRSFRLDKLLRLCERIRREANPPNVGSSSNGAD
jgi:hypothetical protein